MNGKAQWIVATIMLAMMGWIVAEQRALRSCQRSEIRALREDIADLREGMVRLEGQVKI